MPHAASAPEAVLLIGAPGSGKTSVGLELAAAHGYRFRDYEADLVERYETAEAFLRNKSAALDEIHSDIRGAMDVRLPPLVVETTALSDRAFVYELIRECWTYTVCLDVPLDRALQRVASRKPGRNLTNDAESTERNWRAFQAAHVDRHFDLCIDTDETDVVQAARAIHEAIRRIQRG